MQIAKNSVVTIEYTLTNPEGTVIDQTQGRGPLVYLHGVRQIIPGLEAALEGRAPGDEVKVTIEPENAYGLPDPKMEQTIPREQFPKTMMVTVGQQFEATGPNGKKFAVRVTKLTDTHVTVDGNHALAGVTLLFNVKIVDVRSASAEEQAHGHAHGPGGHQH